jgi:hypothetical protein
MSIFKSTLETTVNRRPDGGEKHNIIGRFLQHIPRSSVEGRHFSECRLQKQ